DGSTDQSANINSVTTSSTGGSFMLPSQSQGNSGYVVIAHTVRITQAGITLNGPQGAVNVTNSQATISFTLADVTNTAYSVTSGVMTLTGTNTYQANDAIVIRASGGDNLAALANQIFYVQSASSGSYTINETAVTGSGATSAVSGGVAI